MSSAILPAGRHRIDGPGGVLELQLDRPTSAGPSLGTVVLGHPHPLFGGTMDNKVVQTLARAYVLQGWSAVRFNFRGVGASEGVYDEGKGEKHDFLAVVSHCADSGALAIGGFSFGAFVASQVIASLYDSRPIHSIVLVGTATSRFDVAQIPVGLHERALIVHGERDETVPLADVMGWARPQNLPVTVIPAVEHFFHGQLPLLRGLVQRHIRAFAP